MCVAMLLWLSTCQRWVCVCDMTPSCVWHDSFICVTWRHDSFIRVTWLIHMCDMTHSYVWHDSFMCVTWLIRMSDMTHSYEWHDSFSYSWHNSFSFVWHHSLICVTWLIHVCDSLYTHDQFQMVHLDAYGIGMWLIATHCNTPHCNTQLASSSDEESFCSTPQSTLEHPATPCNDLQHLATHTATHRWRRHRRRSPSSARPTSPWAYPFSLPSCPFCPLAPWHPCLPAIRMIESCLQDTARHCNIVPAILSCPSCPYAPSHLCLPAALHVRMSDVCNTLQDTALQPFGPPCQMCEWVMSATPQHAAIYCSNLIIPSSCHVRNTLHIQRPQYPSCPLALSHLCLHECVCVCVCVCVPHVIWMRHATLMNVPCHTYDWVMSHVWLSHVAHVNESCHTYGWVMSHMWMSHVTHTNESCHSYEWVMSHIYMSHVTHESCHTCEWVMSNIRMSHAAHVIESYHIQMGHVSHINAMQYPTNHRPIAVCCVTKQCVAVCCSVLKCVKAVCYGVL